MITYTALATALRANAAAVAVSAGGGSVATATITGLAELLDTLASNKGLGLPPLQKGTLAKEQISPE